MEAKDSRPISDLSHAEFVQYFGPKPRPAVPEWKYCEAHGLWYCSGCLLCTGTGFSFNGTY